MAWYVQRRIPSGRRSPSVRLALTESRNQLRICIGYQYFVAYDLPVLRVRPFNSFGPRQTETFVVADFARQIAMIEQGKMEPILTVGNLQAQRDFLPVEDVARALLAVAQTGTAWTGIQYWIGSSALNWRNPAYPSGVCQYGHSSVYRTRSLASLRYTAARCQCIPPTQTHWLDTNN